MGTTENLSLTLACWDYDRTRPIMENRVRFDGIDLTYLNLVIEEIFFRQMRHHEFDVSELSFSSFLVSMFEEGFVEAQRMAYDDLHQTAALKIMLPWLIKHVADTEQAMGRDFWAYGYGPNVEAIETLLRYHYEQGLSRRQLRPQELFAPETLESFRI